MQGFDAAALRAIDQELKEAVCDALVNLTADQISGTTIVYGASPRRAIVSGQLLPRFDEASNDESSDIRIATIGLDFQIGADASGVVSITPSFAVYVRVLPSWSELADPDLNLDLDFALLPDIQRQIDDTSRAARDQRFAEAGLSNINWRELSRDEQDRVRAQRALIADEVRRAAYAAHGILLEAGDSRAVQAEGGGEDVGQAPDEGHEAQLRLGRLMLEGRAVPFHLLSPSPIPAKWRRIDLALPSFDWDVGGAPDALAANSAAYNDAMRSAAREQVTAWLDSPDGARDAWRSVEVRPQDAQSEAAWSAFLDRVRTAPPPHAQLLPKVDDVTLGVENLRDFADPARLSIRVTLDNRNTELRRREATSRTDAIFRTQLTVSVPGVIHRPLRLDRVEPSYRYRDFLLYPAMGLNCGVHAETANERLVLRTTWTPRFVQPRTVPRRLAMPLGFAELAREDFDVAVLEALPDRYAEWIEAEERRLRPLVQQGLGAEDAARELRRLDGDIRDQEREARYIRRGVELLIASRRAATEASQTAAGEHQRELLERAAPYRAWRMMNQAFASRDGNGEWRLFQLAFILAHAPVFASRMAVYRDYHDPMLDEEAASLLYFPTGGGKSEAFYGALLFSLFLDRLRGKQRGVTAMIRYPLRLLTLQQGQRLLKLLAHAELVRREESVGSWPFEIGFWVGGTNTPNRFSSVPASTVPALNNETFPDDARLVEDSGETDAAVIETAEKYRAYAAAFNKIPQCPVCGAATGLRRCETHPTDKRLGIICFNAACRWNRAHGGREPLPFLLTDDAIYARAPAVVLGTVDKMAMLGQHPNTIRRLLGMFGLARFVGPTGALESPRAEAGFVGDRADNGYSPVFPAFRGGERVFFDPFPSLIIQDEAHLLEESLGTFSGLFDTLFETALRQISDLAGDELHVARAWTGDAYGAPRMPKVIAATATVSNPERQLAVLYQRAPLRFPCPGSDIYRSFFSIPAAPPDANTERQALAETLPSAEVPERTSPWMRLYVSLMTNDATHTVTAVAALAAFHVLITGFWRGLQDDHRRDALINVLREAQSPGQAGEWRRLAIDRAIASDRISDIMALIDLHRIGLTYVTNKKGGDQVMDALDTAARQRHRADHLPLAAFVSRLISGGVDIKEIQSVMNEAGVSYAEIDYPPIDQTVRSIVATSAISHGVDVDRFNSMFFAGLPSDIAEYIQASSRVGRTHVGFVMLIPTPQSRRDRYVVETHDIFHRFLERMIAPPAVERWAENAIRRVLASVIQTWAMLTEARRFFEATDATKERSESLDLIRPIGALARFNPRGFADDIGNFVLQAVGYGGRGPTHRGEPVLPEIYRGLVDVTPAVYPAGTGIRSSSNAPDRRPSSSSRSRQRAA
jgi:hypothetical protein